MGNPKYQRFFALIDDYIHDRLSKSEKLEMEGAMKESKMLTRKVAEAEKAKEVAEAEAKTRAERIRAKLSGELNAEQEQSFALDMKQNNLLKEEFERENQIDEGFRQLRYQKFKAEADKWKEDLSLSDAEEEGGDTATLLHISRSAALAGKLYSSKAGKPRISRKWLAVAASLLVLVIAAFLIPTYFTVDRSVIAARESFTMPTFSSTRGGSSGNTDYDNGIEYFRNQNYEKALTELQKVKEEDPNYEEALLTIGLIALETPDSSSIASLSGLSSLTSLKRLDLSKTLSLDLKVGTGLDMRKLSELDIRWYLALGYIKEGEKEEGVRLLDSILLDESHPFYIEAKELKAKLE